MEEGEQILRKLLNSSSEVDQVKQDILESLQVVDISAYELFCTSRNSPAIKRMILVVFGVAIMQQLSGIETVM